MPSSDCAAPAHRVAGRTFGAISFEDVVSQGASSLDYLLRNLVPSFNVATHPISGAASLVRPASLRNLAHDHTLVLVNGKRRRRSAILVWFGGVTDGTQGPDISTIPATALRQVEVLRDGASAQFGLPYSQFTPWGLSGGYYYARLHRRWGR